MKKILLLLFACCCLMARAYDFCASGMYFNIINDTEVELACGNTSPATSHTLKTPPMRDLMTFDFEQFQGNSYSGDFAIPLKVTDTSCGKVYNVVGIGEGAFCRCKELTSVEFHENIRYIRGGAFLFCVALKEINIPDGVRSIGPRAFCCCYNLKNVKFPLSTTAIYDGTFMACGITEGLSITGVDNVTFIDENGFRSSGLLEYPAWESLERLKYYSFEYTRIEYIFISQKVRFGNTANGCFSSNHNLKSIEIESYDDPYTNISNMFYDCPNISEIKLHMATPPYLNSDWASKVSPDCILYVPGNCIDTYKNTNLWKNFMNIQALETAESIGSVKANHAIKTGRGFVEISTDHSVKIFTTDGRICYQGMGTRIPLPGGIYIINLDGESLKIKI